ncbi:MAG: FAD-dependent oxidoreductase, partial [Gemmatimonadales bacterium]|nr:FAD-dependent oxidoreductase [Gemmatimonadales bacterium]
MAGASLPDPLECEVLVIGSGMSGGVTALELADAGVAVVLVARSAAPDESNTSYAQGGIIYKGREDTPEQLARDIEVAGAGYCHAEAVAITTREGP